MYIILTQLTGAETPLEDIKKLAFQKYTYKYKERVPRIKDFTR